MPKEDPDVLEILIGQMAERRALKGIRRRLAAYNVLAALA
jgi:hypothetical protein